MPKVIVSFDGVVLTEHTLLKERTTLGRRPFNDIVIDNLAISGQHLALLMSSTDVFVEDLNSTNGTYVNGKVARKQALKDGDVIEAGKHRIVFVNDVPRGISEEPVVPKSASAALKGSIKVLSGAAAGREVPLVKPVTTFGKPGVAVAAITRGEKSFSVHHVEGGGNPKLNGEPLSSEPRPLNNGDQIELAGTRMQFIQS